MAQKPANLLVRKLLRLVSLPYSLAGRYATKRRIAGFGRDFRGRVLEVGCGRWSHKACFPHAEVVSTDLVMQNGVDKVEDVTHLSFRSGAFDAVIMLSVLEHVYEYQKAIAEVTRVLKPGGTLILGVPFFYPLHDLPNDYWRFSPNTLERLLEKDFKISKTNLGGFGPFVTSIEMWLQKK